MARCGHVCVCVNWRVGEPKSVSQGYYAPPVCQQNPAECIEFQHIQPGWDTGYLEQVASGEQRPAKNPQAL
eukprot:6482013-Amphidinium_carterae.2